MTTTRRHRADGAHPYIALIINVIRARAHSARTDHRPRVPGADDRVGGRRGVSPQPPTGTVLSGQC